VNQTPYVIASYAVTLAGIAAYVWRVLRQARRISTRVGDEDRPWT
jgi:CcmD family protein